MNNQFRSFIRLEKNPLRDSRKERKRRKSRSRFPFAGDSTESLIDLISFTYKVCVRKSFQVAFLAANRGRAERRPGLGTFTCSFPKKRSGTH